MFPLRQGAVEYGNAVLQLGHEGRRVTAQHAAIEIVLLQGVFERRRLLFGLAELGVELALVTTRRLNQ